ncbi:hypothetical protein MKX70_23975 [Paenibacillus sp. FSL R7-0312]|uniref:hypothetical protein n=1 Tax=Paenibacillus sp. FSL R7-0312 TaxID=2921682 RepID=UPI0030FA1619
MNRKLLSLLLVVAILSACSSNVELTEPSPTPSPVATEAPAAPSLDSLYEEAKGHYEAGDYTSLLSSGDQMNGLYPDDPKTKEVLAWSAELYKKNGSGISSETAAEPTKSPDEVKQALSGLRESKDEVRNISFFYAQSTSRHVNENDAYVYFSKSNDGVISNPRFRIQFAGDDWIFIDKYTINADGEIFELTPEYSEVIRDNSSGGVWEYYEPFIDKEILPIVQKIGNAEKVIIRAQGESRHYDMTLTKQQKQAMLKVLKAYNEAGGLSILFEIDL